MRIISKKNITPFYTIHPKFKAQLQTWSAVVKSAQWETPADAITQFPKASIIKNSRVVFRKGNGLRIIISVNYRRKIVYIRFIGTHAEYDKIDAETVKQF